MTLLKLTTRYYLIFFLMVLTLGSCIFYIAIKREVDVNADEALFNRRNAIIHTFQEKNGQIDQDVFAYSDFILTEMDRRAFDQLKESYADTLVYEPTDNEWDEYRRLITSFSSQGHFYKLRILKPQLENNEIIAAMSMGLGSLGTLMVVVLIAGTRWLSRRLWTPFEGTLQALQQYRLDQHEQLALPAENIDEFDRLNKTLNQMSEKNLEVYLQQQKFIENASHEIQTPLAIIRTKLELLLQASHLSARNASLLEAISQAVDRLSKLNRTLLWLVKIENQQFFEKEHLSLAPIIESFLTQFADQYALRHIRISQSVDASVTLTANRTLIEMLFANLIQNAFAHNVPEGDIRVKLSAHAFVIENSGRELQAAPEALFARFIKYSSSSQHMGLGLALVKQICDTYGYQIGYTYHDLRHICTLQF